MNSVVHHFLNLENISHIIHVYYRKSRWAKGKLRKMTLRPSIPKQPPCVTFLCESTVVTTCTYINKCLAEILDLRLF